MANLVVTLANAASKIRTSKGVTNINPTALSKEIEVLFGGIKTAGADVIEVTHRYRNSGNSPFCVLDLKVKDKNGNLLDRLIGSISDWSSNGKSYTVKSRKPSLNQEMASTVEDVTKKTDKLKNKITEIVDDAKKPTNDKHKLVQGKLDFGDDANVIKDKTGKDNPVGKFKDKFRKGTDNNPVDNNKPQLDDDATKDVKPTGVNKPIISDKDPAPSGQKPIAGVLPPRPEVIRVEPAGIEPHPTQHIPNIRDYEIEALLGSDINTRLKIISELSETGRQALFNPMTGEPNVFWTFNREEAMEYFLKLLGRK